MQILTKKNIFIVLILIIISLPYIVNIQQDLHYLSENVVHDEAAIAMNAKDIVSFGVKFLENDRLYILWPGNLLLSLISFSMFGVSLITLRLPYIILNILGNILFYDFIRRVSGRKIAIIITVLFALFLPHILIGKSAMAESLVLFLVIFICWLTTFHYKHPRVFILLGIFSAIAGISKLDNSFVFISLLLFSIFVDINERKSTQKSYCFPRVKYSLMGGAIVLFIWLVYMVIVGWDKFIYYYQFELGVNINALGVKDKLSMSSLALIIKNITGIWRAHPLFLLFSGLLLPLIIIKAKRDNEKIKNPIFIGIILILGLFIFKIFISRNFHMWRIAPCYPLPFLMFAYVVSDFNIFNIKARDIFSSLQRVITLVLSTIFFFFSIVYIFTTVKSLKTIIFNPTYAIMDYTKKIRQVLDSRLRVIYTEGHFAYTALLLPVKCYSVIPNIYGKDFYDLESNPEIIWSTIQKDKKIAYIMALEENYLVQNFIKEIPGAKLIMEDETPSGELGNIYQIRWLNDETGNFFPKGDWE